MLSFKSFFPTSSSTLHIDTLFPSSKYSYNFGQMSSTAHLLVLCKCYSQLRQEIEISTLHNHSRLLALATHTHTHWIDQLPLNLWKSALNTFKFIKNSINLIFLKMFLLKSSDQLKAELIKPWDSRQLLSWDFSSAISWE